MGDNQRLKSIVCDLRSSFIVHPSCRFLNDPLQIIDRFPEAAKASLRQEWCLNRDFYTMHGDATEFLGMASNRIYSFVVHTWKIPFLSVLQVLTPQPFGDDSSHGDLGGDLKKPVQAPTIGTYTSAIYRALQDGTVLPVLPASSKLRHLQPNDIGNISGSKASLIRTPEESRLFIWAYLEACAVYLYKHDTLRPIYYRCSIPFTDRDTTKSDSLE